MDGDGGSAGGSTTQLVQVASRKHRCCRGGTSTERRLKALVGVLVPLVALLAGAFAVVATLNATRKLELPCTSDMCLKSASLLLEAMDVDVDPCRDFYAFACNNWAKRNPVADDAVSNSWFQTVNVRIKRDIGRLLEAEPGDGEQRSEAVRHARTFYRSCLDQEGSDSAGFGPLAELLRSLGLPFELPNPRTLASFRLSVSLARVQRFLGMDLLLALGVAPDQFGHTDTNLIVLSAPHGRYSVSTVVTPTERRFARAHSSRGAGAQAWTRAWLAYATQLMAEVNAAQAQERRHDAAEVRTMAAKTLIFEQSIAAMQSRLRSEPGAQHALLRTVAEVQELMDTNATEPRRNRIDLEDYINTLLKGSGNAFDFDNSKMILLDAEYICKVAHVLNDVQAVTVQRYLWWKVVDTLAQYTTRRVRKLQADLRNSVDPEYKLPARGAYCERATRHFLREAVTHAISAARPTHAQAARVTSMLDDIRASLRTLLRDAHWLHADTRKRTERKLDRVGHFVGYGDKQRQAHSVDAQLKGLALNGSSFLANVLMVQAFKMRQVISWISKKHAKMDGEDVIWESFDPLEVNAFYSRDINAIVVPASMLQTPFYDRGLEALNYGAIGSILGHELTHGFDSEGRKFDADGRKVVWWDARSIRAFEQRARCFVDQYSQYSLESGAKVDGLRTLPENIADNGGLREAFLAYQTFVRREGREQQLPGFERYSHEQMFFLAYANLWCGIEPGPEHDEAVLGDVHAPARARVTGVLANTPEFDAAWRCARNVTRSSCVIW